MAVNRRHSIGLLAMLGLSPAVASAGQPAQGTGKQMVHHVFFWLKNPGSQADRDKLIAGLKTLREIPHIRELRIGVPAATEQRDVVESGYAVSELMVFDSVEDQRRYQEHPLHKKFVATCEGLWERVIVYDSIDV